MIWRRERRVDSAVRRHLLSSVVFVGLRGNEVGATAPPHAQIVGWGFFLEPQNRFFSQIRPSAGGVGADGTAAVRMDSLSICVGIANRVLVKPGQKLRKERLLPAARRTNSAGGASI